MAHVLVKSTVAFMRVSESKMTEISARNVTKFNRTNFQRFQVNSLFLAYGIRDVVNDERDMPAGPAKRRRRKHGRKIMRA